MTTKDGWEFGTFRLAELDSLPWSGADSPPTRNGAKGRRCTRHEWIDAVSRDEVYTPSDGGPSLPVVIASVCSRCGAVRDPAASRRGRSSDRLGKDQERRIERVYGPRKVGEYGDACDHLGRDFKWQSKATRSLPPKWLAAITAPTWRPMVPKTILDPMAHMTGIGGARRPLVIRSFVRQGVATRDWIFMVGPDWWALHGGPSDPGYIVIPGADFLESHGRDEEP